MDKIVTNKALLSRVLTGVSVLTLIFALNVSGALAGFWRTLDGITVNGVTNPTAYLYGFGTSDQYGFGVYGYGYGFGYGTMAAGYAYAPASSGGSSSGGGGGSSSGGGSGGAGLPIYDAETGETTETIDTPTVDTDEADIDETVDTSPVFTDVENNWAQSYIETLADLGIVDGNGDAAFEPERSVTRAEFLKMTLLAFGHSYDSSDASSVTFTDVDTNHWTANVVGRGQELGYIDGYGAGKFRPNDTITREEAIKMLINSAGIDVDTSVTTSSYSDVSGWSAKYIEKARELGIIAAATNFRPTEDISRAESAKIIVKAIEVVNQ